MICPVDKSDMIVVEYRDIELDYCTQCQGVWFDVGEMELLFHKMSAPGSLSMAGLLQLPEARTAEQARKCPICDTRMKKVLASQSPEVMIDICPRSHGIWFDGGELDQLVWSAGGGSAGAKQPHESVFNFLGEVFQARRQPDK